MTTYGIWCKVWGGVTGHREAWYKVSGEILEFNSAEQAQELASNLMRSIAENPHRKAEFSYTVKRMP